MVVHLCAKAWAISHPDRSLPPPHYPYKGADPLNPDDPPPTIKKKVYCDDASKYHGAASYPHLLSHIKHTLTQTAVLSTVCKLGINTSKSFIRIINLPPNAVPPALTCTAWDENAQTVSTRALCPANTSLVVPPPLPPSLPPTHPQVHTGTSAHTPPSQPT
jgi:hypothetical protein